MEKVTNTAALLERARKLCNPPTWYQLSKRTGIKQQTLSRCMKHGKTLDDRNAIRLATLLGMLPIEVIGYMQEDRAPSEEIKTFWTNQLPRLVPSIAIAVTASLTVATGSLIDGSRVADLTYGINALYIMRSSLMAAK